MITLVATWKKDLGRQGTLVASGDQSEDGHSCSDNGEAHLINQPVSKLGIHYTNNCMEYSRQLFTSRASVRLSR